MFHRLRRIFVFLVTLSLFQVFEAGDVSAQFRKQSTAVPEGSVVDFSFDGSIRQIRNNAFPDFSCAYDDYLQYAPAVMLLGMKAFGYESRSGWGRMLVSDAFSVALMAGLVNGLKYTVKRPRPGNGTLNSFPSGHTATAFMAATMLHKEYGWRSPWFSFGAYTAATATALGRILNDRHWATDLLAGAAIGIISTQLGYLIADRIFKDKYLAEGYGGTGLLSGIVYDPYVPHYEASIYFGYRIFPGRSKCPEAVPYSGGSIGLQANFPLLPGCGVSLRASANSVSYSSGFSVNMYNVLAGGYWQWSFARILALEVRAMFGWQWQGDGCGIDGGLGNGVDVTVGPAFSVVTGDCFKLGVFAEYEGFGFTPLKTFLHSFHTGLSAIFFW